MKSPNGAHELFICVDPLSPSQQFSSDVGTGIPGLNPMRLELARLKLFQLSHSAPLIGLLQGREEYSDIFIYT